MAMGAFATTLITVSCSMLDWRGVASEAVSVGNLCFVAGLGLVISAQWEMLRGQTFSYTVLCAYGELHKHLCLRHSFVGFVLMIGPQGCSTLHMAQC